MSEWRVQCGVRSECEVVEVTMACVMRWRLLCAVLDALEATRAASMATATTVC